MIQGSINTKNNSLINHTLLKTSYLAIDPLMLFILQNEKGKKKEKKKKHKPEKIRWQHRNFDNFCKYGTRNWYFLHTCKCTCVCTCVCLCILSHIISIFLFLFLFQFLIVKNHQPTSQSQELNYPNQDIWFILQNINSYNSWGRFYLTVYEIVSVNPEQLAMCTWYR